MVGDVAHGGGEGCGVKPSGEEVPDLSRLHPAPNKLAELVAFWDDDMGWQV